MTSNKKRTILSIYKLRCSNWTTVSNYKPFTLRWKYSKGLCTGQLKLTYTHNIRIILFKSPLNNTNPWVTFLQNQQPVTTHSMNPLMLPFLPKSNHQTRFLMQENPNMSSPQGTYCIATRGDSQNCFQCLTCCETQSCYIHLFFVDQPNPISCNVFLILKISQRQTAAEKSPLATLVLSSQNPKKYVVCLKSNTNLDICSKCNVVYIVLKHVKLSSIRKIKIVVQQLPH